MSVQFEATNVVLKYVAATAPRNSPQWMLVDRGILRVEVYAIGPCLCFYTRDGRPLVSIPFSYLDRVQEKIVHNQSGTIYKGKTTLHLKGKLEGRTEQERYIILMSVGDHVNLHSHINGV